MNNNTIIGLIGLMTVCAGVLLYINFSSSLSFDKPALEKPLESENQFSYNDVKSIAVIYNDKPYLLNFTQQNSLIGLLNEATMIDKSQISSQQMTFDIKKIIIYPFNGPGIEITPFSDSANHLIFSVALGNKLIWKQELNPGALKTLLSETYDH